MIILSIAIFKSIFNHSTDINTYWWSQFLKDTVFMKGIEVYESVISALSSFEGVSDQVI